MVEDHKGNMSIDESETPIDLDIIAVNNADVPAKGQQSQMKRSASKQ